MQLIYYKDNVSAVSLKEANQKAQVKIELLLCGKIK